ncbi:hypothetical protein RJ641_010533 [Dillenia turbinata]|uniref:Uncharacterized protein n=1 Tax=Dillenia turbinata TaxID=194707 RepID=A0AAN8Z8E9_9MAGN
MTGSDFESGLDPESRYYARRGSFFLIQQRPLDEIEGINELDSAEDLSVPDTLVVVLMWFICYNGTKYANELWKSSSFSSSSQVITVTDVLFLLPFQAFMVKLSSCRAFLLMDILINSKIMKKEGPYWKDDHLSRHHQI